MIDYISSSVTSAEACNLVHNIQKFLQKQICLDKILIFYNYIHKKRFEALFCLRPVYILADNCFMKYWHVVLLALPKTYRSPLYIKLATVAHWSDWYMLGSKGLIPLSIKDFSLSNHIPQGALKYDVL
jgi:hypothetical protein